MADDSKRQNTPDITLEKKHKLTPAMEENKWKKRMPSPNPGGRPKTKPMTDEMKKILERKVPGKGYSYLELFVARAFMRALRGNDTMTREIWNPIEGILHVQPRADGITQVGVRVIVDDMPRPTPPGLQTVDVRAVSKGASNKGDD